MSFSLFRPRFLSFMLFSFRFFSNDNASPIRWWMSSKRCWFVTSSVVSSFLINKVNVSGGKVLISSSKPVDHSGSVWASRLLCGTWKSFFSRGSCPETAKEYFKMESILERRRSSRVSGETSVGAKAWCSLEAVGRTSVSSRSGSLGHRIRYPGKKGGRIVEM